MKKDLLYNFAELVLTDNKLKKLMKPKDFKAYISLKENNGEMSFDLADKIATAIKKWALEKGATHYTHWFFPLTGKYAEKHISFLEYNSKGDFIKKFNGNCLIKGETDASSFPSGGERLTFEARGYTVWDYSSPVFIKKDDKENKVLYIPTAFCTYNGVAVDEKTPLLRATEFLNKQATKLLNTIGYTDVTSVVCHVGCEQEYFLIDKNNYYKRKDLVLTGRTLLGAEAIKSQETSHHYLGQIKSSVSEFMHDLNKELWELGIMAKIQHNEVAPTQHEIVAVYSQANIVADQNSLLMEVMNKVAHKHNFKVLFHEKPYKGVNGSGKHNNWSISTNTGINLLDSSKANELVFMLFFTSVISAIDNHYDLLKMSTSSLGNDLRLGGSEAPPSIISVFVGDDMSDILNEFVKSNKVNRKTKAKLDFKTSSILKPYKDNCDRNRTTPFAYTGNKFEFRMVGSSQSIALSNTVLATIVGNEIKKLNAKLNEYVLKNKIELNTKTKTPQLNTNLVEILTKLIVENISNHSRIIFNGNSYDELWNKEATKRGLIDYKTSVECFNRLLEKNNIELFETNGVLTHTELKVRFDTYLEKYISECLTEAKTLLDMCLTQVLPCVENYLNNKIENITKAEKFGLKNKEKTKEVKTLHSTLEDLTSEVETLKEVLQKVATLKTLEEKANFCQNTILTSMNSVRFVFDKIEPNLPKEFKPFPNYDDLLFLDNN